MPGITFLHDRRDNPLDAHKGSYDSIDFSISAKAFGSGSVSGNAATLANGATAANFTRLMMQHSWYQPLWHRSGSDRSIVFAHTTRMGIENVFGSGASTALVPLPERFYMGGGDSLRGFALNQAGPRDLTTGFPLGGRAVSPVASSCASPVLTFPWWATT